MTKRAVPLFMAVVMMLALSTVAFAADTTAKTTGAATATNTLGGGGAFAMGYAVTLP